MQVYQIDASVSANGVINLPMMPCRQVTGQMEN